MPTTQENAHEVGHRFYTKHPRRVLWGQWAMAPLLGIGGAPPLGSGWTPPLGPKRSQGRPTALPRTPQNPQGCHKDSQRPLRIQKACPRTQLEPARTSKEPTVCKNDRTVIERAIHSPNCLQSTLHVSKTFKTFIFSVS